MLKRYIYVVGFIISVFFSVSFLITAILSLLNPATATEMLQANPYFSWMNPKTAYTIHVSGNIFFTAVGIFFALDSWRKYNR